MSRLPALPSSSPPIGPSPGPALRMRGEPRARAACLLLALSLALPTPPARAGDDGRPEGDAPTAAAGTVDAEHTRIGFTLKTRWGQVLRGRFPEYTGSVERLADGRRRVLLRLAAREVVIDGHPNYTRYTRGEGFFDAERFPEVSFVSDPYAPALLREGGTLSGTLHIRDVRRAERFQIAPSACANPGEDCDVVAVGSVRRSDYGVDRWMFAVSDQVRFTLHIRVRPDTDGGAR